MTTKKGEIKQLNFSVQTLPREGRKEEIQFIFGLCVNVWQAVKAERVFKHVNVFVS